MAALTRWRLRNACGSPPASIAAAGWPTRPAARRSRTGASDGEHQRPVEPAQRRVAARSRAPRRGGGTGGRGPVADGHRAASPGRAPGPHGGRGVGAAPGRLGARGRRAHDGAVRADGGQRGRGGHRAARLGQVDPLSVDAEERRRPRPPPGPEVPSRCRPGDTITTTAYCGSSAGAYDANHEVSACRRPRRCRSWRRRRPVEREAGRRTVRGRCRLGDAAQRAPQAASASPWSTGTLPAGFGSIRRTSSPSAGRGPPGRRAARAACRRWRSRRRRWPAAAASTGCRPARSRSSPRRRRGSGCRRRSTPSTVRR